MENNTASQTERILKHLLSGKSITALEALRKYQCFRLASRISDLKSMNLYSIKVEFIKTKTSKKKVAKYSIQL